VGEAIQDVQANMRAKLREASSLFRQAGYTLRGKQMVNEEP